MRNVGLLAFGLTTAILVPAAVQRLTAGPTQVAKLVAPSAQSLSIGTTKIDASLDRVLVDPGESIKLKLTAHEAKAKRVSVGVLVLGSTGSEGDRVPSPPVGVAHHTVTIDIDATGTGTKEIALKLKGAINRGYGEPFAHYQVLVMAPKAADKLESLRSRARLVGGEEGIPWYNKSGGKFMELYQSFNSEQPASEDEKPSADAKLYAADAVAMLEAHTRPKSSAITITAPDTARTGETFAVVVNVKNPTKKKITDLAVSLDAPSGLLDGQYLGMTDKAVVISPESTINLGPGESKRVEFQVSASATGVVGLYARATCEECRENDALGLGAFEATEIQKTETAPLVGRR